MAVPTLNPGTDILSEQYNKLVRLFTGASGQGSDTPVSFSRYTSADSYALTVRHRATNVYDYKGLLVQDKDGNTTFEVAALGGGTGASHSVISAYAPKFAVGNVRNWVSTSDFVISRTRLTAGTTTSFVPAQLVYETAVQPTDGFGGVATVPDEVGIQSTALAKNTASGAGQNGDVSLRAGEFVCIQYQNTGTRSMAALTLGMHTAVAQTSFLDNPSVNDDFYGSCGIILLTDDSSARTGFGTNVAPNCGYIVAGTPTWKFGFGYLDSSNNRLFTVDSGGSIRFRGNLQYEPGVNAHRLVANLSGTDAQRFMFETNVTNGASDVSVKPIGSGASGGWSAFARDDIANSEGIRVSASTANGAVLESFKTGSATAPSIFFKPNQVEKLRIEANGNICPPDAGLATNATAGFLYIPSANGPSTGTPTVFAGTVPLCFDRVNNNLEIYSGGAWLQSNFA